MRRRKSGVHAVALTPERRIVLVSLRYARGWRLPGGGRNRDEEPEAAVLRELREEIGLISHGAIRRAEDHRDSSLFIIEDVTCRPRWSLEVKAVRAFPLAELPPDTACITRHLLAAAQVIPGS